jgi:hypothetical protein
MAEVFLSYSRTDRPIAQAIAGELQRLGVDVWWDHELIGGDDYRARIAEVLTRSLVATVIWSRRSIESQWVVGEASAARERKSLIPITIDGAAPPLDFRPLHTIDFVSWVPGDQLPPPFLKAVGDRLGRDLSYEAAAVQSGALGRLARRATQAWYLDFENVLFYLIGQGLACFLCTLPMAFFAQSPGGVSSAFAAWPAWMPYLFCPCHRRHRRAALHASPAGNPSPGGGDPPVPGGDPDQPRLLCAGLGAVHAAHRRHRRPGRPRDPAAARHLGRRPRP